MKTFEKTHPWIKFQADLRKLTYELWIMLGECQSKCEHIAGVLLQPKIATELHQLYLAKGVLATTAIEGNTLTEQEVLQLLQKKLKLPPSKEYLAQEVTNILGACNGILQKVQVGEKPKLDSTMIREFNQMVLKGLSLENHVKPGEIRTYSVSVGNYKGAPAEDCEYLLERLCEWTNGNFIHGKSNLQIVDAIIKAALTHLYFAWIHPFGDGNGRTARLIEFLILINSGVPSPAAHLLSNHYNQTRTEYYRQLDYASKSGGEISSFLFYAVQGFRDGLKSQIEVIKEQQWHVTWRDYVHWCFQDKNSVADKRRRDLVLDLSFQSESISLEKLTEISARIAKAYAGKTKKTLSRDVNELIEMKLVEKIQKGYRVKTEQILAFLPVTVR